MKKKYDWLNHVFNFLAVILGVYLAFYMNERAKMNEDRKESLILMHSLIDDLSEDITVYEEYQIPVNVRYLQDVEKFLNEFSADSLENLDGHLSTIFQIENFAPTTSTYSSMKSSGKLRLIEDLSLRKKMTDYYDGLVLESRAKGEYQVDYFTNELLIWFARNVDLSTLEILNKDELLILRNKLLIYASLIDQKVKSYEMTVASSRELKLHIESIIEAAD